ncbi:T9SS type B sorting domain-containing protein [Winogradskyella sp. PE311]|uniref:T9SS type B sorting domain-containing protein n=1 Tax=Winogradskyella sp. PE311 TaxID=3366943 RepID=UPI00397F9DC7
MTTKTTHRVFILLMTFLLLQSISAQNERNHWYFGILAGMKYNGNGNYGSLDNNTIVRNIVFGEIEGPDNIICASDELGNLMFYSDGRVFKNREHQNMLNSPTDQYSVRYAQAAVARDPGNANRYYVFVTVQDGLKTKLTYNVVDMTLDNGLGGLDPNYDHEIIVNATGELMVTAQHANGKDLWLICVRRGRYHSYLITENGISTTPVASTEGISFFDGNSANFGVMEISPDNKLIAAGFPILRKLFLLEFNNLTGKVDLIYEEEEEDQEIPGPFTGVEFSANSKVLYTTYITEGIQQYDISDLENIPPRINITPLPSAIYPYLKRGPDGKIFSSQRGRSYIGAIQNPNIIGEGCNYSSNVLTLSGAHLLDLPTFLLPKKPKGISFKNICERETTEFSYNVEVGRAIYEWDLGDGTIAFGEELEHTYASAGTYTVTVNVYDEFTGQLLQTESKDITIYPSPSIPSLNDLYFCNEDTTIFFSNLNEDVLGGLDPSVFRVYYYFSERDALLKENSIEEYIPEIGTKTVWTRVENALNPTCYDISQFNIETPEYITIDMPSDYYICDNTGVVITAPDGFISYEWSTGETTQEIIVYNNGQYTLKVIKDFETFTCEAQTTIFVSTGVPPIVEDIKVIDWSLNHNSIEVILSNQGDFEFSVDGVNYQSSAQLLNLPIDDYQVYVREANCLQEFVSDTLFLLYYDRFFTPNEDGVNDYWQIINSLQEEDLEVYILNRYGRIMAKLDYDDRGWDGTYKGVKLPSNDYWFRAVRNNGDVHYGHFTLKR